MIENKGFTAIPNEIFDLEWNVQEQNLYIALLSFYDKEKGYASPSYKDLKERAKISDDRTLIKHINTLIEKNLLKKETVRGVGNKYYLYKPNGELY